MHTDRDPPDTSYDPHKEEQKTFKIVVGIIMAGLCVMTFLIAWGVRGCSS